MRRAGRGGIALGALATIPGILAACAPSSGSSGGASSEVRWLNWPAYIDISDDGSTNPSIDAFKEETGHRGRVRRGPARQRRVPGHLRARPARGQRHRLGRDDARRLGRGAHGAPRLAGGAGPLQAAELDGQRADYAKGLWFDPDNKYSVWWQGGITGLAYDPDLTGREITTFDDLLDPAFSGRAGGFSDMRDMFGLTLLSLGVEPANATIDEVTQAAAEAAGRAAGPLPRLLRQRVLRRPGGRRPGHLRGLVGRHQPDEPLRQRQGQVRGARHGRHALERQHGHPQGRRQPGRTPTS